MKGYFLDCGFMGWIPSKEKYMLFVSDTEYYEYYEEDIRRLL